MKPLIKHWLDQEGGFCGTKRATYSVLAALVILVLCAGSIMWRVGGKQENFWITFSLAAVLISIPGGDFLGFIRRIRQYRKVFGFLPPTTLPGMARKDTEIRLRLERGLIRTLTELYRSREHVTNKITCGELAECNGTPKVSGFDQAEHRLHEINHQIKLHEKEFGERIELARDEQFPYPIILHSDIKEWIAPRQVLVGD